ncbi:MAG: DUF11 domain-containing protein [Planctomycetaceae bacterium]|nr:DUF11 domain-containing protein [Planctomycetaceae bacterium]
MCGLRVFQYWFRISIVTFLLAEISLFVFAQSANNAQIPQNQAQLQSPYSSNSSSNGSGNGIGKGGLVRRLGDWWNGNDTDTPANKPHYSQPPANVPSAQPQQSPGVVMQQYPSIPVTPPRPEVTSSTKAAATSPGQSGAAPYSYNSSTSASPRTTTTYGGSNNIVSHSQASTNSMSSTGSFTLARRVDELQNKGIIDTQIAPPSTGGRLNTSRLPTPPGLIAESDASLNSRPTPKNASPPKQILSSAEEDDDKPASPPRKNRSIAIADEQKTTTKKTTTKGTASNVLTPPGVKSSLSTDDELDEISNNPDNAELNAAKQQSAGNAPRAKTESLPPLTEKNGPKLMAKNNSLIKRNSPVLEVEADGAKELMVDKESTYRCKVTNSSLTPAESVVLNIEMPRWMESRTPELSTGLSTVIPFNEEYSTFQWQVGKIEPGKSETLVLHVIPREWKSFELKVTYDFKPAGIQVPIEVQKPVIVMSFEGKGEVLWGAEETYQLRLKNTGNGDASDIKLLLSASGMEQASTTIPSLRVGEENVQEIKVITQQSGNLQLNVQATGPYGLSAETSKQVIVHRANLDLDITAPGMQFVGNIIEYTLTAQNSGSAPAENAVLEAMLPPGVKYISNTADGEYDAEQNCIRWSVKKIPVGETFTCSVMCEAKREGDCRIDANVSESTGTMQTASAGTQVTAIADVDFKIEKPQRPIAIGETAEYAVIISNNGTKAAEGVEVAAYFEPNAIAPIAVEGDAINKASINPGQSEVIFTPIPVLAEGQSLKYIIKVKGLASGNHKMHVEMVCQSTKTSLSKQQTSYFYEGMNKGLSSPQTRLATSPITTPNIPAMASPQQRQPITQANAPSNLSNVPTFEMSALNDPNKNVPNRIPTTSINPLLNRNHEDTQLATTNSQGLPSGNKVLRNMQAEPTASPSFENSPNEKFAPNIPNISPSPGIRSLDSAPRPLQSTSAPRTGNSELPTPPMLNH